MNHIMQRLKCHHGQHDAYVTDFSDALIAFTDGIFKRVCIEKCKCCGKQSLTLIKTKRTDSDHVINWILENQ